MKQPWQSDYPDLAAKLGTDSVGGIAPAEASARLEKYGPNALKEKQGTSPWKIFFGQFQDFMIWVLAGAALVSGFMKEFVDALAIITIVILNAVLGFIQEFRAEKALAALKKLSSPSSKIIRGGTMLVLPSAQIVPGDLVELEAGDNVPADGRLVWLTTNFATSEASLTGESTPVTKTTLALDEAKEYALADRANMVYMGTAVVAGKARAIILDTGMQTELGKIAGMIQDIGQEETPLQKKLEEFGKSIVYVCFVLVGLVFALGLIRAGVNKENLIQMFLTAVSLAVAAIPEGLPAVVTISLAMGVQRMVKRHALIRKLPSVETLGCATVICSDKTGTLTKNEMTVQAVYAGGRLFSVSGVGYEPRGTFLLDGKSVEAGHIPELLKTLQSSVLCNGAQLTQMDGGFKIAGDPTEAALLTVAAKAGIWKKDTEAAYEFVQEIPFDSERKQMTMVRKNAGGQYVAFVKGAPDMLLDVCVKIESQGAVRPMTTGDKEEIVRQNDALANQAMRVLAVAYRPFTAPPDAYEARLIERDLIFLGLIAMIDPPRPEVREAMKLCKAAGIRTVMITGDHKATAVAIAKALGFFHQDSLALTGEELDALDEEAFASRIEQIPVYARVSPEHKLRIVRAWRSRNQVVAMTGDGVNDAPAVKEADIGVAMGITGTDVTKEVSDMVVTDDNFASIVSAVEEGRGIYDNIKKFIHYLLSCNVGEILVMFISTLIGWPIPLLPIHILWVNLVTDGLPALALGLDPVDPHIMQRPPRSAGEKVVTGQGARLMVMQGAFIAFCSLAAFSFVLFVEKEGIDRARTAAFVVLSCAQLFHAFNCRSMTESLFKLGIFSNPQLIAANLMSFSLQMAVVYVPFLQTVFKTEPLGLFDWCLVIGLASLPLWAMELFKLIKRRGMHA
ncbi:MAG TPA: calcium-translocating P-type ATPase, SERCA-type [Candidatus Omnitrophota bacterium]|nr:calcium-translocating P-type ATPase, SERCA-type [Candidatus Omnitrophota bacterium]